MLVNNAGLGGTANLVDMTDEQWITVLDVTLNGTFRCMPRRAPPPGAAKLEVTPSMAPTSKPPRGWTATMNVGSPEISRARITRCRFPPESRRTGVVTLGAMMS